MQFIILPFTCCFSGSGSGDGGGGGGCSSFFRILFGFSLSEGGGSSFKTGSIGLSESWLHQFLRYLQ